MAFLQVDFFSQSLQLNCSMNAILPQAPAPEEEPHKTRPQGKRYPVLYLLHGLSDDHTAWVRKTAVERYAAEKALAIIMPAVNRSFYADMYRGLNYWTFISEELPAICQDFFPLSGKREDTFVAGLSMGGYGAFKLALTHPERFAAAASFSGALDLAGRIEGGDELLPEWPNIFGEEDSFEGSDNDLMELAKRFASYSGSKPKLYQHCGTEDFLYEGNVNFRDHAKRLGIDLEYDEGPGEHTWDLWDEQIEKTLNWLPIRNS